ncbi:aluminum-activated malate transporter 1 [Striga asiatica]|uniref:Aluminum-activated malate transporter 1 n=1 Tax=Striga asiatica TaxID=4170 RepID=A0A5A7RIA8_STRAF|nr:aluminum-activated malate transporter 1 [Striga asiatica]
MVTTFLSGWLWLKEFPSKALTKLNNISLQIKKIANDDPRRLTHSLKVGLALTLVSLFYYFQPLYSSFGVSAMWAVMTVVVVFEFSVGKSCSKFQSKPGATLGKGLNRGLATLVAGGLGLGAHHLAVVSGKTCEPILIGLFVFLQAVVSTFIRFFPTVKARYDYGMLIFILTFCLVSISGLKTHEILEVAHKRLSTVAIGASTCVVVSIFVYPVWAGEDLHKLVAKNIDKIGNYLQGTIVLYSYANFARWEPGHGRFMYRHPWKQYLKIASLTRNCACRVEALKGYLNSKSQAPQEIRATISNMSSECGKALKELAWSVETMTKLTYPNPRASSLKTESKKLSSLLKSDFWGEQANLVQVIPVAAVASLLNDTVAYVESIADAIDELSTLGNFESRDATLSEKGITEKNSSIVAPLVSVVIDLNHSTAPG